MLREGELAVAPGATQKYRQPIAERPIGVDLRQGWGQKIAIPYSGVVDEFRRKYVRNDYLLTALQEAGIRDLRVPIDDLLDPQMRTRMGDLAAFGHRFHAFSIDPPSDRLAALLNHTKCVQSIEVIARPDVLEQRLSEWRDALGTSNLTLLASRMLSSADFEASAVRFAHPIGHGFRPADLPAVATSIADGAVIRISPEDDPQTAIQLLPRDYPGELVIYLSLTSVNPAISADDDAVQSQRILNAIQNLRNYPNARLMLDALEDHDRGYFPRHGLYDGLFNPRPIARALSRMEL